MDLLQSISNDPLSDGITPSAKEDRNLHPLEAEILNLDKAMSGPKEKETSSLNSRSPSGPPVLPAPKASPPLQALPKKSPGLCPVRNPSEIPIKTLRASPPLLPSHSSGKKIDLSEDEWTDRGNMYGESNVLQCELLYQTQDKTYIAGTLTLTNFAMYFESPTMVVNGHLAIPVTEVAKISNKKKNIIGSNKEAVILEILTRDFRELKFVFKHDRNMSKITKITPERVTLMLHKMCFPGKMQYLFAFDYGRRELPWKSYDSLAEYRRMGIGDSSRFRVSSINKNYGFCETYPQHLVFPADVKDDTLKLCGEFRRRKRLPALTWKAPSKDAALFRCSQPQVGMMSNSSQEDTFLLKALLLANKTDSSKLYVLDCRPWKNAVANKVQGAGWENQSAYPFCQVEFLGIENIHVMYKSRHKLGQAIHICKKGSVSEMDLQWLDQLGNTDWMAHIRQIIKGARGCISRLQAGSSVLVHCSDGWDRTSQICGLTEICMDGYYRTTEGFITLIQKDWLDFGHQFGTRSGIGLPDENNSKRSPVFEQFLDTVFQLLVQFPTSFEFTSAFLVAILKQYFSARFGTFLFNTSCEREKMEVSKKTACIWNYLQNWHRNRNRFTNPFFRPSSSILIPSYNLKTLKFWGDYYLQHSPERMNVDPTNCLGGNPMITCEERMREVQATNEALSKELDLARSELARLSNREKTSSAEQIEEKDSTELTLT